MSNRRVLAVMNDPHSGHRLGLLNPDTLLYQGEGEGYRPGLTASQEYLWNEVYTEAVAAVQVIADGADITLIVNGDLTQGDKYPSAWVSTRKSDQLTIAKWNLAPFYQLPNLKRVRITKGTGAHNFGEGSSEITLTEMLSDKYPRVDTQMTDHGLMSLSGVVFDYAHHGPGAGNSVMNAGNAARNYLRARMLQAITDGREPADVYLRAHVHTPVWECLRIAEYTSTIRVVPSLCMLDDHAQQATRSVTQITHGICVYEVEDGEITGENELYQTLDLRQMEVL